jgi:hypothetical protein
VQTLHTGLDGAGALPASWLAGIIAHNSIY